MLVMSLKFAVHIMFCSEFQKFTLKKSHPEQKEFMVVKVFVSGEYEAQTNFQAKIRSPKKKLSCKSQSCGINTKFLAKKKISMTS